MSELPHRGTRDDTVDAVTAQAALDAPDAWTPCRDDPAGWDIDRSGVLALWAAVRACRMDCPLLGACRVVASSGRVPVRAMVWAGVVYDDRGRTVDLNRPRLRIGPYNTADTRIADRAGRIYNGHNGRWETPPPPHEPSTKGPTSSDPVNG